MYTNKIGLIPLSSWKEFEEAAPDFASFGVARFRSRIAYLATVRKDGSPRLHPVTPIIAEGHLLVFMEPTSPKGHDLRRDARYALHSSVSDQTGQSGEFSIGGQSALINDQSIRDAAIKVAGYTPSDPTYARYILFEFNIDYALTTVYKDNEPIRRRWQPKT